ncbi:hypothetical protein CHU94_14570 [Rhodoferax sp. TH121]|uniref:hypothetical protein n=1 Tax=Rhodoferax sp. TH121 TaxID=2022803 RepID=UPI000B95E9C1|nr:hypothetical protein [Rhodoferax sp. TH121]OYQ38672.1 hypothetical protein CHU94_14570 [Rhodoferax sp. TH121]
MTTDIGKLEARALAKFVGINGVPVKGKVAPPSDIEADVLELKSLVKGNAWTAAGGISAFDFSIAGKYCVALKMSLAESDSEDLIGAGNAPIELVDFGIAVGLFLIDQLKLTPRSESLDWVEEYIAFPASQGDGVDFAVLRGAFEEFSVFRVRNAEAVRPSKPGASRHVANFILAHHKPLTARGGLSQKSIDCIREIFLQERSHLFDDNLFTALSSPIPRHAFLELYRTLEFVFVLPRVRALAGALKLDRGEGELDLIELARACYSELRWKRVERDSLERLFDEYSQRHMVSFQNLTTQCKPFNSLSQALGSDDAKEVRSALPKFVDKFYALRNQVVHQLWKDEETDCDADDWTALAEFTIGCVKFFYERYLSVPVRTHAEAI